MTDTAGREPSMRHQGVVTFILDGESFELTPGLVLARLMGHMPEGIRDYWVEIDGTRWPVKQVISLATGVTDRQRFQSQSARRWLAKLGFALGRGNAALAAAVITPIMTSHSVIEPALASEEPVRRADVVLVGCVKRKLNHGAPAKELYVSDYFVKMRRYAERAGVPWFILSAEHGLVSPDDWLEPYERYLSGTPRDYRRSWGRQVAEMLDGSLGDLTGIVIEVHAGSAYVDAVQPPLTARGAVVIDPLQGLSIGRRLSWYLNRQRPQPVDIGDVVSRLRAPSSARSLTDVLAMNGAGLRSPGLYSWWVDAAGAADLTAGLGHPIQPGLIYAGLAGATRSGGSASSNTLWGRIATMHLGKNQEFSTLRRSLGSILAHRYGQPTIDEAQLTRWMHAHLSVVTIPVSDADTLDALETVVLTDLDPPVNLAKVAKTPCGVGYRRSARSTGKRPPRRRSGTPTLGTW